ncbi:hypothetical protein SNEBB_002860, partial [Seison nebaliae]
MLNINKAAGPDGLSSRVLKEGINSISEALYLLFKKTLECGEVPEDWKQANVVPVHKKGSKEEVGNYRPVRNSQHGFWEGKSCLTNLLEYLDYVTGEVDKGKAVDVIYFDFAKAFDSVSHGRLLQKLESVGIRGLVLQWITNWLCNRRQCVMLDGIKSEWHRVNSGVPQGSVLGPLLFVVYINDLDSGVHNKISKFADDAKLVATIESVEDNQRVQKDINKLIAWAYDWKMKFNKKKCK